MSDGKRPAFAPASTAMFDTVSLSSAESRSTASPVNSMDLYVAPSAPMSPMILRIKSFAKTPRLNAPLSSNRKLSGILNHVLPRPIATAMSVEPMPVEKAARAPPVHVWESEPTSTSPGKSIDSAMT